MLFPNKVIAWDSKLMWILGRCYSTYLCINMGFPGGSEVRSICLQCGRSGFDPWVGKIPHFIYSFIGWWTFHFYTSLCPKEQIHECYYFLFFSCEMWHTIDTRLHFAFFTELYNLNIAPYYFTEVLPIIVRLKRVDRNSSYQTSPFSGSKYNSGKMLEKKILGCSLVA